MLADKSVGNETTVLSSPFIGNFSEKWEIFGPAISCAFLVTSRKQSIAHKHCSLVYQLLQNIARTLHRSVI